VKRARCGRAWEAEAIEDGRLDAQGAASFERHLATCSVCEREVDALARLREFAQNTDVRPLSPLEHRRLRATVLRRANEGAVVESKTWRRSAAVFGVAVLAVALAVIWAHPERWFRRTPVAAVQSVPKTGPSFELRPVGDAVWHTESTSALTRVALSRGTLSVHVEHMAPGQRFVLDLPDGELEVRGTRFIVDASLGRTDRVVVTEGVVTLRLKGAPERRLVAGETFTREPTVDAPAPASRVLVATAPETVSRGPSREADKPTERGVSRTSSGHPNGATIAPADAALASGDASSVVEGSASRDFIAAMNAFSSAAYLEADERLAAFTVRFPAEPRCEDAIYLRAVIALRRGDRAAAEARARDYLGRFPNGLRSPELERLLAQHP